MRTLIEDPERLDTLGSQAYQPRNGPITITVDNGRIPIGVCSIGCLIDDDAERALPVLAPWGADRATRQGSCVGMSFALTLGMSNVTCDVLDRLEEAVVRKSGVRVTLRDGRSFTDDVQEVVTESGHNYGVFATQGRIDVEEMTGCDRV